MPAIRETIFTSVGSLSASLPPFRGRTRAFLLLYKALGLAKQHVRVQTQLTRPVPYQVRLDLHSWLQRIAFLTGGYEESTTAFLLKLYECAGRHGYLLDVGANVGLISVPVALTLRARAGGVEVAPNPLVVSVEAVKSNSEALRCNVEMNQLSGAIEILETALGEIEGTAEIQVEGDLSDGEGSGTANILARDTSYVCVKFPLRVTTLDALVEAGEISTTCSVVKLDTDGYDLKVLQGGGRFLRACRPVIFGEFSAACLGWHGQSLEDVEKLAKSVDYFVWKRCTPTDWRFTPAPLPGVYQQDLLLVPQEAAERFGWCRTQART